MTAKELRTYIAKVLEEVKKYSITLPKDPIGEGLDLYHEKVALRREYSNRVLELLIEANRYKSLVSGMYLKAKQIRDFTYADALVNDVNVSECRDAQSRKSQAELIARKESIKVNELYILLDEMKAFYDVVDKVYYNLEQSKSDILTQWSVIKIQFGEGDIKMRDSSVLPKNTKRGEISWNVKKEED